MVLIEMIIKTLKVMELLMKEKHKGKIPEDQRLLPVESMHIEKRIY